MVMKKTGGKHLLLRIRKDPHHGKRERDLFDFRFLDALLKKAVQLPANAPHIGLQHPKHLRDRRHAAKRQKQMFRQHVLM